MRLDTITIVGVGLIGGSIGSAIKTRAVARHVVGVGRDERTLERARVGGAIDAYCTSIAEGVRDCDLAVICTPVDRIAEDVLTAAAAAPERCVITDAGSTKSRIVRDVAAKLAPGKAEYIGSHPLAGSEKRGAAYSNPNLFVDRVVVVTPTADSDRETVSVVEHFWQQLGSRVVRMNPEDHDRILAATSHLPHAVASALAGVTQPDWLGLSAGGFRDTTRIAGGDPELWAAIFLSNRDAVLESIASYEKRLNEFQELLETNDREGIIRWLAEGIIVRDALGS